MKTLDPVRRWLGLGPGMPGWDELLAWSRTNGWSLRRAMSHDGWVMTGHPSLPDGRVEWGPSQRHFMSAHELRVRVEVPQVGDAQALVLDKPLLARMDHEVYQQATESVQTRYDDQLPEEMRWLAMHARLSGPELGALRDRYGVVGPDTEWLLPWMQGEFTEALRRRASRITVDQASAEPMLLRLSRGHLVLRQAADHPTPDGVEIALDVARAAVEATRRMPPVVD